MTSASGDIVARTASATARRAAMPGLRPFEWSGAALSVSYGADAAGRLAEALGGLSRLMWVSGRRAGTGATAARIRDRLGARIVAELSGVPAHSAEATVRQGAALARAAGIDGLLAIGGGSASDTAKAIAILLAEGGEIADHANVFHPPDRYEQRVLPHPKLPVFAVPMTASAAEVTPGLGIRADDGHKMVFWDPKVVPRHICIDPKAATETPAAAFLATAMNALAHCVEAHYSKVGNPVASALALHAIGILTDAMPAIARAPEDAQARGAAMIGAHLSGLAISSARVGLHHAICHGLGSLGGLSHGDANAIMLPHVVAFNGRAAAAELAGIAAAMGREASGPEGAGAVVSALRDLQAAIGCPTRLRDAGFDRSLAPEIARMTMSDRGTYFNPVLASGPAEIETLIEAAW